MANYPPYGNGEQAMKALRPKSLCSGRKFATLFALTILASLTANHVCAVDRIPAVDNANLTRIAGTVHPLVQSASDLGALNGSTTLERMALVFNRTPAQQSDLDLLLQQQQDPSSPNYHKWLTPEQFGERFGLGVNDFDTIAKWLNSQGFNIVEMARSRTYIAFSGTAAQVEKSLHTQIHRYSVNGEVHYANSSEPTLPSAIAGVVQAITALNNFRPRPRSRIIKSNPRVTSSVTGNHFMQPGDIATIYDLARLYNSGIDGTGQTIAVMGQTDLVTDSSGNFTDVATFRSNSGLSAPNLKTMLVAGQSDPGILQTDIDEASLDVEWAGGVAKNASILFVIGNPTSGNGTFDALPYTVANDLAPVITISYGLCEPQLDTATRNSLVNAGQQANAQGQTIVAPGGDSGAADCDHGSIATQGLAVDFPGSMPYATSAGGSEFNGDTVDSTNSCAATTYWSGGACTVQDTSATAVSYIPEMVWNDTATNGTLAAGGGGASRLFTKPTWQTGTGVPADGQRDVPDISFSASADHDGYLICSQGSCVCGFRNSCTVNNLTGSFLPVGGTSVSAPAFAGIVSLINQNTGTRQGNVNPTLYSLAASTPQVFHDITTGSNIVPCMIGTANCSTGQMGYSAAFGYDLASGWGSVDAGALLAAWGTSSVPAIQIDSRSVGLTVGSGGTNTNSLTIIPIGGLSGTINLSCLVSSTLPGVTCSVSPSSLSSGRSAVITIVTPATKTTMSGTVTVIATSGSVRQSLVIPVTVQIPLQFVAVTPCRVEDTRNSDGEFGGPAIQGGTSRDFTIPDNSSCGIPSSAAAYSLNVTVVPHGPLRYLTVWPSGQIRPLISTLNSYDGRTKANAAVVPAGVNEAISIYSSDTTDVVLDINGYFVPTSNNTALAFYPVTPCRVIDTRNPDGMLAGPFLTGGQAREFPVLASTCELPGSAQAYSMNFTAVPHGPLGYLTVWPTGQIQPYVSTLNAPTGTVTANAAIVPAGTNGEISTFADNDTDLIIDIDGYFAAPGQGGLSLYPSTPCRLLDTRSTSGAIAGELTVNVGGGPCGIPAAAQGYVLNATVVPASSLGFLSLWPDGQTQPLVSTLNAVDSATTSNMAMVPTLDGLIDSFASSPTQLILDISSFFAQ